ncbi:MAG: hypothetical protein V7647_997 [Acidobacteriota bacterium]|jgi:uncharacterized protein (DUF1800 family)
MLTRGVRFLNTAFAVAVAGTAVLPASGIRTAVPEHPDDKTIVHVLNRIGFGPAPGEVDWIRRVGLARYLDQQLEPERIVDSGVASRLSTLRTLQQSSRALAQGYFVPAMIERRRAKSVDVPAPGAAMDARPAPERATMMQEREVLAELAEQKILRAAYSERQLQEVMVDFWFNHFNVFAGKGATRIYLTEYERDAIRPNALGRFRTLLGAIAESPAMLFYLDNWESAAPEGSRPDDRRRIRPRRARPADAAQRVRGLNENYARELMELHTVGVDGGYTQHDVQEVARAFSGWTIAAPRQGGAFRFEPRMHDDGEKVVLGHRIRAGGGRSDGEQVLDILAAHPATARFVATKLVRRFVSDAPPAPLVERASAVYRETGGNIRDVVRAILTSPEFFAPDAYRAKVKTPFEFVVSAVRATASDAQNALPLVRATRELGMPLYYCQPPTGYADRADAWVNTGALLNRMNFAVALTTGDVRGVASSTGGAAPGVDAITRDVLADDVSAVTRSTVARATGPAQGIALLLGSPEFQRK